MLSDQSSTTEGGDEKHPDTPWLRPRSAALYLGVSVGTLRNWTSARYVPFARRGRVVRYHREALDRWLSKGSCPGRTTIADARVS
jgi:excisionase family DNA binding protein